MSDVGLDNPQIFSRIDNEKKEKRPYVLPQIFKLGRSESTIYGKPFFEYSETNMCVGPCS